MKSHLLLVGTFFATLLSTTVVVSTTLPSGPLTPSAENPLLRNGPEWFDYWKTGPRVVIKEGASTYRMWYEADGQDNITRVGYAVSSDGLTWTKMGIVMPPTESWEADEVSPGSILFEDGEYKLWYHGGGSISQGVRTGVTNIGYATSVDGLRWTKTGSPVVRVGSPGSFDDRQVAEPRVVKTDTEYRMYYTGQSTSGVKTLGLAISTDGLTWSKYAGNPILSPDRFGGWGGAFIIADGIWNLWHARIDDTSGLVYKWSYDGISWQDGPNNPVLAPSGDPNRADAQAAGDSVSGYLDGSTYRILYTGFNENFRGTGRVEAICLATIETAAEPPPPGPPPQETPTLTASPSTIQSGETSVLTLTMPSTDYHNVFINGVRPAISCTSSTCTGTLAVSPTTTTTYAAQATNSSGVQYAMPSTTVTVRDSSGLSP